MGDITRICLICKSGFNNLYKRKYCSDKCYLKSKQIYKYSEDIICSICGIKSVVPFLSIRSRRRKCCDICTKQRKWMTRKRSPESCRKMGLTKIGNTYRRGSKCSKETKDKMSLHWKKNPHSKEYIHKIGLMGVYKQQTMKEPTSIEKKLYEELKRRGFLFETQKIINGKFLVDAYIPLLNLVIEADGDYWHTLPRVMGKDKAENAYLTKCGYNLLRLSETEINNTNFGERIG